MWENDYGELTLAQINEIVAAEPDKTFVLRISPIALEDEQMDDPTATVDDIDPVSPIIQLGNPEQVPTDDAQRPLHLVRVANA